MNNLIASKADLTKWSESIQMFLEITVSEDPTEIVERGNQLTVYMAQTGKMLADAKYHQDQAVKNSILQRIETNLSPSTLNKLIDADCEEENYLVNWIERLNRTCTHQLDWCRSTLSKAKEEMRHQSWQS